MFKCKYAYILGVIVICVNIAGCGAFTTPVLDETYTSAGIDKSIFTNRYAYSTLTNQSDKNCYEMVADCMLEYTQSVFIPNVNSDALCTIYKMVCRDFSDIFWIDGYSYSERSDGIEFIPSYTMTLADKERYSEMVTLKAELILSDLDTGLSDYEKLKYVYTYLTKNVRYSSLAEYGQNILGAFVNGETVCLGYAKALQYLLSNLGIESATVTGTLDGISHAWNIVKLDDDWYQVDVTTAVTSNNAEYVDYKFMTMTDFVANKHRAADDIFTLPECSSIDNNYFKKQGLFFTKSDEDKIINLLESSYENDAQYISLAFATEEDMYAIKDSLLGNRLPNILAGVDTIEYTVDAECFVISIKF